MNMLEQNKRSDEKKFEKAKGFVYDIINGKLEFSWHTDNIYLYTLRFDEKERAELLDFLLSNKQES